MPFLYPILDYILKLKSWIVFIVIVQLSCNYGTHVSSEEQISGNSHLEMVVLLNEVKQKLHHYNNGYNAVARIAYFDSLLISPLASDPANFLTYKFMLAESHLQLGNDGIAIRHYTDLLQHLSNMDMDNQLALFKAYGTAFMRQGERINCLNNHSANACILPIKGSGIHHDRTGSAKAIEIFKTILDEFPNDLDTRWLLNIAYMTLGEYPSGVPPEFLIKDLGKSSNTTIKPFKDMAAHLGIAVNNMAGGVIVEDFNGDGYLDIVTSGWGLDDAMHFFQNMGDGTFIDRSTVSGLSVLKGGLNMVHADYNNDGFPDILVLRGGWQGANKCGEQPNSLIKNNGDGTFADVTTKSGLLTFRPTQTATWNDFNNDGWLDLFIGNESSDPKSPYPCELYINNQDGTFVNVAKQTGLEINMFIKGVTSGDFDNDGWPDIFISAHKKILLRNKGIAGKIPVFEEIADQAGITDTSQTFGTFFWDYNNDGLLDIFMANYIFKQPLSYYAAKEAIQPSDAKEGKLYLYHNNGDLTFTEVSKKVNLDKLAFAMGNNFGDIDNDGWLDIYLGTGNPSYQSLVPNKLFRNINGQKFEDVTTPSRTGHLQKGHGIAFADLDNDGDQDIYAEMGGAYQGDNYPSAFFLNPGQNSNNWICIELVGTTCNRMAVGSRVEVKISENGIKRSIFRDVNAGGSFGCSPFRREIGIGKATKIDELRISWPVSGRTQIFKNINPNQFIRVTEGKEKIEQVNLKVLDFQSKSSQMPMCKPERSVSEIQ